MRTLVLIACLALPGCAYLPDRKTLEEYWLWPSKTTLWCHPKARIDHEAERYYLGIKCWLP